MKISAIIITLNEEKNIANCLASLEFADEIIVVDSGSVDHTEEICRANPRVRFFNQEWLGYGQQKNSALERAANQWILSLDADELVTPELAAEIRDVVMDSRCDGYTVRRKNFYRGQWVRHSGWWPDPVLRLFRKDKGVFSDRVVHESVELNGQTGHLNGCLEHHSFSCVSDFLRKADGYSSLGAQMMQKQEKHASVFFALLKSAATFFKTLLLKRGFLDGYPGVLIAYSNAAGVFYRCIKLIELQQASNAKK